jgi:hypothetical protein
LGAEEDERLSDRPIAEATAYALKALDFDTESSEAHLVLGNLFTLG